MKNLFLSLPFKYKNLIKKQIEVLKICPKIDFNI